MKYKYDGSNEGKHDIKNFFCASAIGMFLFAGTMTGCNQEEIAKSEEKIRLEFYNWKHEVYETTPEKYKKRV